MEEIYSQRSRRIHSDFINIVLCTLNGISYLLNLLCIMRTYCDVMRVRIDVRVDDDERLT